MSRFNVENELFLKSKQVRDSFCSAKDDVLISIIGPFIRARQPNEFTGLFMPALYGREVFICAEHGVPMRNVFAIEQEDSVHEEIMACHREDRQVLRGMKTTPKPLVSHQAMSFAHANYPQGFDIVYLDFFGYPSEKHYKKTLLPIFRLNMLKYGGLLVLTFAKNRANSETKWFNDQIIENFQKECKEQGIEDRWNKSGLATETLIFAAAQVSQHRLPKDIASKIYITPRSKHRYTTTFAWF